MFFLNIHCQLLITRTRLRQRAESHSGRLTAPEPIYTRWNRDYFWPSLWAWRSHVNPGLVLHVNLMEGWLNITASLWYQRLKNYGTAAGGIGDIVRFSRVSDSWMLIFNVVSLNRFRTALYSLFINYGEHGQQTITENLLKHNFITPYSKIQISWLSVLNKIVLKYQ